jgi:hypothetical protein
MSVDQPVETTGPVAPIGGGVAVAADAYPLQLQAEQPPDRNRAMVLLRCFEVPFLNFAALLAILPSVIVLLVLEIGVFVGWIVSWFTVMFTGSIPRGLFEFEVGVLRWAYRLGAWMFLLTDQYPPFSFDQDAHEVKFSVQYPEEGIQRWRGIPLLSAILAIPIAIVAEVILLVSWLLMILPPIIPGLVPLFVLFGGRIPDGLYSFMRGGLKLQARAQAYSLMLVRAYPPFDF